MRYWNDTHGNFDSIEAYFGWQAVLITKDHVIIQHQLPRADLKLDKCRLIELIALFDEIYTDRNRDENS